MADQWFVKPLGLDPDWSASTFSSVTKWIRVIRRRGDSRATKQSYFKCLATFMRATGMDPDQIVKLSPEKAKEAIQDFCDGYAAKKRYSTAHIYLNCLRSFLKHNGKKDLELEDYAWKRSKRPERVPTKDEVYRMAEVSDLRDRAVLLTDFQSGLRNATLRALRYGDIKDQIESGAPVISVHVTPQLKERVPEACKENVEQYTFFGKKATEALRLYLEERKRRYGPIGVDEPLFRSHSNIAEATARSQPVTEDALQRLVKKAARKAGIKEWHDVRFHSLRKTFKAVLDAGFLGGGGQLAEDDKEYLMGHVLPGQKAPYHNANVQVLQERFSKLDWGGEPGTTDLTQTVLMAEFNILMRRAKSAGLEREFITTIERNVGSRKPRTGGVATAGQALIWPIADTAGADMEDYYPRIVFNAAQARDVVETLQGAGPGVFEKTIQDLTALLERRTPARRGTNGRSEAKEKTRRVRKTAHNGGMPFFETRIVADEEELLSLLNQGWDILKELADGRIVVRRPKRLDE